MSNGGNRSPGVSPWPWQPVSANPQRVQASSRCPIHQATQADWDAPSLLLDYFNSASGGIGRDLEVNSLQVLLNRALQPPVLVGLFAEAGEDAKAGLILEEKTWDSEMLSVQVRNLTLLATAPDRESRKAIASRLATHFLKHYADTLGDCIFARIPSDDAPLLATLEDIGFHVLVPMVTLGKDESGDSAPGMPVGIDLGDIKREEVDQVARISATAFRYGRFTIDSRIPTEASERLHGAWARNCCLGSHANRVLVARDNHKVLGFIALKFQKVRGVQVGSIELIAVSEASRGRGLGGILLRAGCEWLSRFTKQIIVRTELPNTSALRMYEAQGFRVLSGSVYLSRWQRTRA
jgi:ribosomal protein S18 acetylase RimI-like enzyme